VKAILFINEPGCTGEEAYNEFIRSILDESEYKEDKYAWTFLRKNTRFRQINILKRFNNFKNSGLQTARISMV
jgi:hypothetical protein